MKRKKVEENLHRSVCNYLNNFHPELMYNTDMSGISLTKGQAVKASKLRSNGGFPDLMIYQSNGTKCGLFLELKKETPYKKNGELKKLTRYRFIKGIKVPYDHHQEQQTTHDRLRENMWVGGFYWSIEQVIQAIRIYLKEGVRLW